MHNLRNRGPFDKPHLENITSTLDQTLSDAYYVRWLGAGNLHNDLSLANSVIVATFVGAGGERYPVIQFPNAVTTQVIGHIAKPRYWLDGNVKFRLHWINDTATTNAFAIQYAAQTAVSGSVGTVLTPATATISGITTADAYMVTDLAAYFRVTNQVDAISVLISRLGAVKEDKNTDSFNLVGVEMIYQPGRTVVGVSG